MTWIKIDDSFPDHPRIIGLSNEAFRTHIHGLCYCGRFLTDGFIPSAALSKIGSLEAVKELVEAGLWSDEGKTGGYLIYGYLDHQTSKKQVEEKRESMRERQKRYRERTKEDNGVTNELITEKNLEDAKKVSSIFGFFKSPRKVKENFRQLELDAAEKFEKEVVRYQYAGGNNAYVEDNYAFMPFVAQFKQKQNQAQRQEILKKEREKILGGIKGYN